MKLRALWFFVVLMSMFLPQSLTIHAQKKPEDLAQTSAEAWLALTDSSKYAESWDEASTNFKSAVIKEKWIGMLQSVHSPLGTLKSRKLNKATYAKNPPKAPEGEYVILTYDSSFEQLPSVVETVSTVLDKDGKWRVAGYFIKPAQ